MSLMTLFKEQLQTNLSLYVDDGIISHREFGQHKEFMRCIFFKLRQAKLQVSGSKSGFFKASVSFLGFLHTKNGTQVHPDRFEKIRNLKPPKTIKEVRSLMGFLSYFRKYIKSFAELMYPIRCLLTQKTNIIWSDPQQKHWMRSKKLYFHKFVFLIRGWMKHSM